MPACPGGIGDLGTDLGLHRLQEPTKCRKNRCGQTTEQTSESVGVQMIDMERLVPVQLFRQSNATVEEGEEEADDCYGLKRIFKNLVRSLSNAEQTDQGQRL